MRQQLLFEIPSRATPSDNASVLRNTRKKAKPVVRTGGKGIEHKINMARSLAERVLGSKRDLLGTITTESGLTEYIENILSRKNVMANEPIVALDTETNGLDRIGGEIAGVCLYTPGAKAVYVPCNHKSYMTHERLGSDKQVSIEAVAKALEWARDEGIKFIFHNAKFDMSVCYFMLGVELLPTWDTFLASMLLNENEPHGLKAMHAKYCVQSEDDEPEVVTYSELFKDIEFNLVPIDIAYLYAAYDSLMTYELYEFQRQYLDPKSPKCVEAGLQRVAWVWENIELPLIHVTFRMEQQGVEIDNELGESLYNEYNKQLEKAKSDFYELVNHYQFDIDKLSVTNPTAYRKLSNPINISSPEQIQILLYDVLNLKSGDKKNPRGTGKDVIAKIEHPIVGLLQEVRRLEKLIGTYVRPMQDLVSSKTGKLHSDFKQYGAKTGRYSCTSPNLQNIPSRNKDIRKLIVAGEGYYMVSSDYSQQEPRCLAHLSGDESLLRVYEEGKDLYSAMASTIYKVPYEECREFRPDDSKNQEGKKRRDSVKSVVLGLLYGRQENSIAEQIGKSRDEVRALIKDFFDAYPKIQDFVETTQEMARELGYVETAWGRKRRLPEMQLDLIEVTNAYDPNIPVTDETYIRYYKMMQSAWGIEAKEAVKAQARQEGFKIWDNSSTIAEAERQCVNSVIQGSAADMTKLALIALDKHPRLRELGYRNIIPVHDEIIGICPKEHVKEVAELMSKTMIEVAASKISVPMKCDVEVTERWYGEEIAI